MRRRKFIKVIVGSATAWSFVARALDWQGGYDGAAGRLVKDREHHRCR